MTSLYQTDPVPQRSLSQQHAEGSGRELLSVTMSAPVTKSGTGTEHKLDVCEFDILGTQSGKLALPKATNDRGDDRCASGRERP